MVPTPPAGITPPTPGLEHEEPELAVEEEDIPSDGADELAHAEPK